LTADAIGHDGQPALDLARDGAGHEIAGLECLLERHPRGETLGLVAREQRVAKAVFEGLDGHADIVARLDIDFAVVVLEFVDGDETFGLQSCIDDHEVVVDAHHFCGDDLASTHVVTRQAFLKEGGEAFVIGGGGDGGKRGCERGHRVLTTARRVRTQG
jgi:hypothetical protein